MVGVGTRHVFQHQVPGVVNRFKRTGMVVILLKHATKINRPKKSVGQNLTSIMIAGLNVTHRVLVTIGFGLIQAQQLQAVDLLVNRFGE